MTEIPPHIRGLVFDCDGTIADTMPLHYAAWAGAYREQGCEFPEAMLYELAGTPTVKIIEILNGRFGWKLPIQKTAQRKEELFEAMLCQVTPIEPVVRLIHQYAGILPMAVATGGTRDICIKTLKYLGLGKLFAAVVTSEDVAHGKPAPDIFLESARRLNLAPQACCAFEDGDLGLEAARRAGMMAVDIRLMRQKNPGKSGVK